jgi:glyoxylase-like metal-dependent hydrolase (beta-lactamase superfamily II)
MFHRIVAAVILFACAAPLAAQGTWTDLGNGLAGTHGTPALTGSGTLVGGTPVSLSLTGALENSTSYLVIGLSEVNASFKGGVLVPAADVIVALPTAGDGTAQLAASWPWGLPFGASLTFQSWVVDPAGPVGYASSNALRATTPVLPVIGTFPADWINGSDCANDPLIQVHAYDANTYILRQSMCTNFEGPFMYLFFGNSKAYLMDTGAGGIPIAATVNQIVADWEAANGLDVELIVGHTHAHGDHTAGDSQFTGQPQTTVVGTGTGAVIGYYGFSDWPNDQVVLDLGGRKLDILGIPGHQDASIAAYDRETGLLVTGDTLYPGFLFIFGAVSGGNFAKYQTSAQRMVDFTASRPVSFVMGTHVEMKSVPFESYPYGTSVQPFERDLELLIDHLVELNDAVQAMGSTPVNEAHADFIITPSG